MMHGAICEVTKDVRCSVKIREDTQMSGMSHEAWVMKYDVAWSMYDV